MEGQNITLPLGLAGLRVVSQQWVGADLEVRVEREVAHAPCPRCGRLTAKVHDRRVRRKQDLPLAGHPVVLQVVRRRFRCPWDRRLFTESEEEVGGWRRRTTRRLRAHWGEEGARQPVARVAAAAGVSPTTVERAVHERLATVLAAPRPTCQRLGLDDFALCRGQQYATGMHDLDTGQVLAVVVGRTAAVVQSALEQLPEAAVLPVVSIDMAYAYRAAVQLVCPQAQVTVDKFHVVKRLTEAVREVWRQACQHAARGGAVWRDGRLALAAGERLSAPARTRLAALLTTEHALRRAWLLKEDFRRWYRTATAGTARLELRAWEGAVAACGIPAMVAVLGMLRKWREEILAVFTTGVTQGRVEGRNCQIKLIQRQAYGYRNILNFTARIVLASLPSP